MRNDIQPALQTVKRYFEKSEFYIPTYQRPILKTIISLEQFLLLKNLEKNMK